MSFFFLFLLFLNILIYFKWTNVIFELLGMIGTFLIAYFYLFFYFLTFLTKLTCKFKSKCKISFIFNCGYLYFTKCVNNLIYKSKKKSNYDILWHFMTFYDILWHFVTFYDILWHFRTKKDFSHQISIQIWNFFWILLRLYILHKVCKRFDLKWRKWWLKSQIMTFYDIFGGYFFKAIFKQKFIVDIFYFISYLINLYRFWILQVKIGAAVDSLSKKQSVTNRDELMNVSFIYMS